MNELTEARVVGDGFLRERTERVLRDLYGFKHFDRGGWVIPAGAWPVQRPRIPPARGPMVFEGNATTYTTEDVRPGVRFRTVRVPELDTRFDPEMRVAQVVTTYHRGGAERIALQLPGRPFAIDLPRRATWSTPGNAFQARGARRGERLAETVAAVLHWGADIVHAHLLDAHEMAAFAAFPVVTTAHNAAHALPEGFARAQVELVVGCAKHIGAQRTIWNGVDTSSRANSEARAQCDRSLGAVTTPNGSPATLTIAGELKIAVVANARPQKRFDRWPAVLAALPEAHVYVAGEGAEAFDRFHVLGSLADPAPLYRAVDVFVSLSAYEGMSVAELEALNHGLPVVLSDCAAHRELAALHPHVLIVDADDPLAVAAAIRSAKPGALAPDFSLARMRERYVAHYRQTLRKRPPRHELVLVTNNFAMGGAQSSARRLLHELQARGVRVAAATLQEHPDMPTAGLRELKVEHFVAPPAGVVAPGVTVEAVLDWLRAERLLFWNVIPEHKMMIAELWRDGPVYDVSPGEMYFRSLERYFARPRIGHPVRTPKEYGALLSGVFVKFGAEAQRARDVLGVTARVIANGVELPSTFTRPTGADFVIGTLARLSPDKKLEQLLDAFVLVRNQLPHARLLIGGEPETGSVDYAAELRARYPQVEWLGRVSSDDTFFSRLNAFALIAEPEGCPNASLEAMAHGVPIVGTDAGGAREQIVHGETGFLVPRGDSHALAERLVELNARVDLQRAFSSCARSRAETHFSIARMTDDYWDAVTQPMRPVRSLSEHV